jgi:two-component system, sensor histidine kinase LadS
MPSARSLAAALLLLLAQLFTWHAAAATIIADLDTERIDLGDSFDYRADPSGLMSVAGVAASQGAFGAVVRKELNRGFSRDAHWLRVTVTNATDAPLTRWLQVGHPRLESVRLFWREGDGWRELATGTRVPRSQKPVVAATSVLPLTLAAREERALFIRVASQTNVDMEATLWEPLAFRAEEAGHLLARGAFLSALLLAGGFAFLVFLLMRDRVYLLFALALTCQTAFEGCMTGIVPRYLWPATWPFLTEMIPSFAGMTIFFHALFFATFLDLRQTLPSWNRVVVVLAGLALLAALSSALHDYRVWTQALSAIAMAITALASLLSLALLRRGYRPARFLLAGQSVMYIAVLVSQTMQLGLLPIWAPAMDSMPPATVLASALILLAITERTRELSDALARAAAANQAKSTFLAHMSHELRTPLSTVIGFARLLRKGSVQISPQEGGRAIERSGIHLLSMIDELLDHARSELGTLRVTPMPAVWTEFIDAMAEAAHVMTQLAGNRFRLDADGPFPAMVPIDARRLRQVLENLIGNANRHTQAGEVTLVCRAEQAAVPGTVRLHFRVIDTGEGVAPEDVERIFEPFQRGVRMKTERGAQGAGLGLAISRQLVALMGGELRLEATSPQGAIFGFAIECAALDPAPAASAMTVDERPVQVDRPRTLLVVEDVAESRALLAGMLQAAGFTVIAAASGREALARLGTPVELVLTDQFMPDGDGWEVLRSVRARSPTLPVVLVSAAEPRRPPGFPDEFEFDGTVDKPIDEGRLFGLIGRLLAIDWVAAPPLATKFAPPAGPTPPAQRQAKLAMLVAEGCVSDIVEWAQALAEESPAWTDYANRVTKAVHRLDFGELARLATDDATSPANHP